MDTKKLFGATTVALLLMAGAASAQTTGSTTDTLDASASDASTVGTPNTGAGGNAAGNAILLSTAAAIALGGAAYLARRKSAL